MGFMDNLKDKAEEFGDKAKGGFEAAKDKASDLVEDVKDRFDGDDEAEGTAGDQPTSQDKVEDAIDYTPASLDEAAQGAPAAVDEATAAAEASAVPATDPLDPVYPAVDPVDPAVESVDTQVATGGEEDPLDGGINRGPE